MADRFLMELRIAPDMHMLRAARLVVSAVAASYNFGFEDIEDLKLAVQEAASSRILLGLAADAVTLTLLASDDGGLCVRVSGDRLGSGDVTEDVELSLTLAEALVDEFGVDDHAGVECLVLRKTPATGGCHADPPGGV